MVHLLTFGSRYRQSRLPLPGDEGTFDHPASAFVLRGNIPDRAHVSLLNGETKSITCSFLGDEFIFSRHGKHFTHKAAAKTAQLAASDAATLKVFTTQK